MKYGWTSTQNTLFFVFSSIIVWVSFLVIFLYFYLRICSKQIIDGMAERLIASLSAQEMVRKFFRKTWRHVEQTWNLSGTGYKLLHQSGQTAAKWIFGHIKKKKNASYYLWKMCCRHANISFQFYDHFFLHLQVSDTDKKRSRCPWVAAAQPCTLHRSLLTLHHSAGWIISSVHRWGQRWGGFLWSDLK